jgi:hypothetical protein
MEIYRFIYIAAVVAYFTPLVIVSLKKAWGDPFFRLFAIYWSIGGIANLLDVIPGVSRGLSYQVGIFYNMLDIPFIIGILYYTTSYTFIKRTAAAAIVLVVILSVIGIINTGIDYDSFKYSLAAGVATVLVIGTMEIIRYMQKVEHSTRQNAKMFIYAGLMFEYATFIVIYIFDYVVVTEDRKDSFIIYYVSSVVALLIASCGFLMFRRYEMNHRSI